MQKHSDGYDAYKTLRRVDARVTIKPKAAEFLSKVSITTPEPEYWEIFQPDRLMDGNTSETAAATVDYRFNTMVITLPEKRTPYIKISFADGWQMPQGDTAGVIINTSDGGYSINFVTEQQEIVINEESIRTAHPGYPVGALAYSYVLSFMASTRISEISVIPDSELKEPVVFTSDDIISMNIQEELDPMCKSFPMRKLSLSLNNSSGIFNTFATENFDGCSTKTEIAIDGEYINTGEFFIDSFVTQKNGLTVKITAYDCVKAMEKYKTGYTLNPGNVETLEQLIADGNLAFAGVTFNVDDIAGSMRLAPHMTSSDTQRNVLKNVAQAACGRIWADRNNVVNIMWGTPTETSHVLNADRIYSYDGISDARPPQLFILEGESGTGKYRVQIGSYTFGCDIESVTNNFIASGNENEVASCLYNQLQSRSEMTVKYRGDPCIEINDTVFLIDMNGNNIAFFNVIGVTLDYNGGLSGTLKLKGVRIPSSSPASVFSLRSEPLDSNCESGAYMVRSGINPMFSKDDGSGGIRFAPNPLYYLNGVPVDDEESYLKAGYKKTDAMDGTHDVIDGGAFVVGKDGSLVKIQSTDRE